MNVNNQRPVVIIGAGPTGLTAAMELSRLGVEVRIVDKATEPRTSSRALAVQARTLELLRDRGVGAQMLELGNPVHTAALHSDGRRLAAIDFNRIPGRYNFVLLLAQSETERLLTEQLNHNGVKVERGVEVVSVTQRPDDDGVEVLLRTGSGTEELVDASYLIAADGAHSAVRRSLDLPFEGATHPQSYALADLYADGGLLEDQMSIFTARRGFVAVFPMGERRFRLMALEPEPTEGAEPPTLAEIQRLFDTVGPPKTHLRDMRWSSRFRIESRHMATLRAGRVFFGGDSAHVHSPAGGQGMNTGIQDMLNLSWKLAMVWHGQARPELLDTYESDRLPAIRKLIGLTKRMTTMSNSSNPVLHAVRARVAPVLMRLPALQNRSAPTLAQVKANYRQCPSAKDGGTFGPLHAGDRVPDVDILVGDGDSGSGRTRLYSRLDHARLTLVVTGAHDRLDEVARRFGTAVTVCPVTVAPDQPELKGSDATTAAGLVDAGPGWILIRPDGYVAAAGSKGDPHVLTTWLDRWMLVQDRSVRPRVVIER